MLDDAAGRKALWERLQFALDGEPDPWFERDKAARGHAAVRRPLTRVVQPLHADRLSIEMP